MKLVNKIWGTELHIVNNEEYCGKILFFKDGYFCSVHKHIKKKETFYLRSGRILIRYCWKEDMSDMQELILLPGGMFEVTRLMYHQMIALEDSELFEFSTTDYEDDSYRLTKSGKCDVF